MKPTIFNNLQEVDEAATKGYLKYHYGYKKGCVRQNLTPVLFFGIMMKIQF